MSVVTDILLCTAIADGGSEDEHPNADALSAWLVSKYGPACALQKLDGHAGGNKAMQADVFGAAVNHCSVDDLLSAFRAVPWEYPETALLLLQHENWDRFRPFTVE